jgi:hypothetical protein
LLGREAKLFLQKVDMQHRLAAQSAKTFICSAVLGAKATVNASNGANKTIIFISLR